MPEYICVDEAYLAKLEALTSKLEKLKADYLSCVSKHQKGEATLFQVGELEYEVSKAELALASLQIDNFAKNKAHF